MLDIYLWKNARYYTRNSIVHLGSSTLPDVLFGDPTYHPPHIFDRTNRNAVTWSQEITVNENTNDLSGPTRNRTRVAKVRVCTLNHCAKGAPYTARCRDLIIVIMLPSKGLILPHIKNQFM